MRPPAPRRPRADDHGSHLTTLCGLASVCEMTLLAAGSATDVRAWQPQAYPASSSTIRRKAVGSAGGNGFRAASAPAASEPIVSASELCAR